ncbi:MAG: hypothetical protein JOS17DRAFT_781509 [Linnemannia elongata]|nr:MAG: hypothetical protein JOS17DRAFT_781509 [Linnemannia elongata]
MSSFTLSAPPTLFTVQRKPFRNKQDPTKVQFQGSCADGKMFVIWDTATVALSDEKMADLQQIRVRDQVEVKGKWSNYINKKSGTHKTSFLLSSFVPKGEVLVVEGAFPMEDEYNYTESNAQVMLKAYTIQNDLEKLERRAGKEVRKVLKRSRLGEFEGDEGGYGEGWDEGEGEDSHSQPPNNVSGSIGTGAEGTRTVFDDNEDGGNGGNGGTAMATD